MWRPIYKANDCFKLFKVVSEGSLRGGQKAHELVNINRRTIRFMWKYYKGNKVDFSKWVWFLFDVAKVSGYTLKINRKNVMKTIPIQLRKSSAVSYIQWDSFFASERRLGYELRDPKIPKRTSEFLLRPNECKDKSSNRRKPKNDKGGEHMGFFSDLKEDITIDETSMSSDDKNKKDSMERVAKLGMVGVERYLDKANEYIDSWNKKKPCTFVVTGPEGSGKSALAEAIFKDRGMRYSKVYMGAVQNAKKPLLLFQNLIPAEGGFIIEGFDQVSDLRLKNYIYMLIAGYLSLPNRKKEDLSQLIIVLPMKYKITNFFGSITNFM